jgi:thioredoxin-like negative regulator of GroEL
LISDKTYLYQSEATKYSITAMPTFVFFQHGNEVARLQGANKEPIEQTIKKFYKVTPSKDVGYVRQMIVLRFIGIWFFYRQI